VKKTSPSGDSPQTIYRPLALPALLAAIIKSNAIRTVSSEALAKAAGLSSPRNVRKDLTYFGQFGTRGLGL